MLIGFLLSKALCPNGQHTAKQSFIHWLAPVPMTAQAGAATPWSPFRNRSLLARDDLVLTSIIHKMS